MTSTSKVMMTFPSGNVTGSKHDYRKLISVFENSSNSVNLQVDIQSINRKNVIIIHSIWNVVAKGHDKIE